MTKADYRDRQVAVLRDRLSRLSQASLRINENLDLNTVLQEVVDSTRLLTGARYGGLTTLDESGRLQDFVTSGLTPEEHQALLDLREEGLGLFEFLSTHPEPLRLRDLSAHVKSLGLHDFIQVGAFLGTPICHRGAHIGNFHLGEKEDGREFTDEDEETLGMFAAQAALAIANARQYQSEQRARADLEALIDTSPVGVMVFAAQSGQLVSINREASRIAGDLLMPGRSLEQLLKVLTFRRADGREVALPLAQVLSTSETVRAEEIVVEVPDGRSVTTLVNVTPICSEEGEVESVVVTLQDMTPQEELERLRAEFLGMVSHELRVPLTSIKGAITTLLASSTGLDPVEMRQFYRIIDHQAERMRDLISDLLDVARIETGSLSITPEPTDVASLVDEARNTFLSGGGRSTIEIDLPPDLPWVMADRHRIVQVLNNLLSNAARYSEASSAIRLTAVREDYYVGISVADEGRGIPADLLPHLFRKFSPVASEHGEHGERETHGTGLGLAICKGIVEAHGGRVWADSDGVGLGTKFTFTVPLAEETRASPSPKPQGIQSPRVRPEEPGESILVVDDDPHTLKYVRDALANAGYIPIVTADPGDVAPLIQSSKPQLVLLDLVLPGTDGIKLMEDILDMDQVPVILLSGYGRDEIIAQAFEKGASDYVVKPFSPTELIARIQAVLRKDASPDQAEPDQPYVLGDLTINYEERRVTVAGRPVRLTAKEYQLLYELSVSPGGVLTHDVLLRRIWGLYSSSDSRLVRTLVKRLRRKLGDAANDPRYIFTEPGVGYRIGTTEEREKGSSEA